MGRNLLLGTADSSRPKFLGMTNQIKIGRRSLDYGRKLEEFFILRSG
jgi:hypothetical protein